MDRFRYETMTNYLSIRISQRSIADISIGSFDALLLILLTTVLLVHSLWSL